MTLVNGAEAAKQMGVSRWFISSLKRAGVPISLAMGYTNASSPGTLAPPSPLCRVFRRCGPW